MTFIEFMLFRVKLMESHQLLVFGEGQPDRKEVLRQALLERPSIQLKNNHQWQIGNVELIDEHGGYFAVGRTSKTVLEKFDEETANFIEESHETSPYTHAVFDLRLGLLAVARKSKLSPTVQGIARQIQKVLGNADAIASREIDVAVDPISDPQDFVDAIKAAYSVRSYEATFKRPNPVDVAELFKACGSKMMKATAARSGSTKVKGDDLDKDALVSITASVAATGDQAKASLRPTKGSPVVNKKLHGRPVNFHVSDEEPLNKVEALEKSRDAYLEIRNGIANNRNE